MVPHDDMPRTVYGTLRWSSDGTDLLAVGDEKKVGGVVKALLLPNSAAVPMKRVNCILNNIVSKQRETNSGSNNRPKICFSSDDGAGANGECDR